MNSEAIIVYGLICVVLVFALLRRRAPLPTPQEEGFGILSKPTLWWFVDAERNARHWYDFGGRSSDLPNRGYLQIALKKVYETQGDQFTIKPLLGRKETLAQIRNANPSALQLPPDLWRSYVIANLCAQYGGLVVDGNSTLFISKMPTLSGINAAMFGVYPDEPFVSPTTAVAPGPAPYVGWSASKGHPTWTYAAEEYNNLVNAGPQAWGAASARRTFLQIWKQQQGLGLTIVRGIDGSGLQLQDIFGKTPVNLPKETTYISYDGDMLARRYEHNWFLRLSSEQIRESNCVWCVLSR
jgi:hypothetical protein